MSTISPIHPAYATQMGALPPNMLTPASGMAPYYPGAGMPYSTSMYIHYIYDNLF